jgi:multidrug efflux pump subunit AcrA (membrane-fusion protein)
MRFLRQSLMGLFFCSVAVAVLFYAGDLIRTALAEKAANQGRPSQNKERVFAVNVVTGDPTTVRPVLIAFGDVKSRRTLEIRSAVSGQVIELSNDFVDGGQVAEGQVLAVIDPANAQDALARNATDLADAKAGQREAATAVVLAQDEVAAAREQVALRQKALQRQTNLQARGVGTVTAVETAELAAASARQAVLAKRQSLAVAKARVDQAATRFLRVQIAREEAARRLSDTKIIAGFDGTLSAISLVEGGLVSVNERLAQLIDPAALEVAFRVSTAQYARLLDDGGALRPAPVKVTLSVYGTDLVSSGQLSRDSAAVGEGQTGRLLFARLDQSVGLKPGDFVTVEVTEPPLAYVMRLPSSALNAAGEVLVLGEGDRLQVRPATLLRRQGDDVLVRAPDLRGAEIVAERSPLLGAGIKVRPLRATDDTAPKAPDMLELTAERRAKLVAYVTANKRIPTAAKKRLLTQLEKPKVPAQMVERIESRMGG